MEASRIEFDFWHPLLVTVGGISEMPGLPWRFEADAALVLQAPLGAFNGLSDVFHLVAPAPVLYVER